jgi:hypothetical protein
VIFAFENLSKQENFIESTKVEKLPDGFMRLQVCPTASTMIRYWRTGQEFENFEFKDFDVIRAYHAKDKYIISTGVNHSPEQWVGKIAKNYWMRDDGIEFKSIFEWLSPKYMKDLQEGRAMLMLDQSHEGYQRSWLWNYFHDECTKYNINPKAIIYITGNGEADKQYQTWCNTHNLQNRMCVAPLFHFENMIYTTHEFGNFRGLDVAPTFEENVEYKTNNKTWTYNLLQKRQRSHRLWIYKRIVEEGLLDKGLCSMQPFIQYNTYMFGNFMTEEEVEELNKYLPLEPNGEGKNNFSDLIYIQKFNKDTVLQSYLTIVSEASFNDEDLTCFISEKTFKALASHTPFMIYGNRNSLEHLKDMGYETFGDFIDESYDTMADKERLEKIIDNIKQIDKIENKLAWYKDMKPILEHNFWTLKRNSRDLAPQAYIKIQNAWREYFNV